MNCFDTFLNLYMVFLRLWLLLLLVKNIEETPVGDLFVNIESYFRLFLYFQILEIVLNQFLQKLLLYRQLLNLLLELSFFILKIPLDVIYPLSQT